MTYIFPYQQAEKSRTKKGEGIFGEDDDDEGGEDGIGGISEKEQKKLDKERKKAKVSYYRRITV